MDIYITCDAATGPLEVCPSSPRILRSGGPLNNYKASDQGKRLRTCCDVSMFLLSCFLECKRLEVGTTVAHFRSTIPKRRTSCFKRLNCLTGVSYSAFSIMPPPRHRSRNQTATACPGVTPYTPLT